MEENNQTNQDIQEEVRPVKKWKKILFRTILWVSVILISVSYGWLTFTSIQTKNNTIKEVNNKYDSLYGQYSKEITTKDSALIVIDHLSRYRELGENMIYRDSIRSYLPHKIGDIVYSKLDSTKYILEDIITGGTKYSYYIKYRVRSKDKVEEIDPILIY